MNEPTTTWPDLAARFFEKLTGRRAEITCEFVQLELQVPGSLGSATPHAHWKLNGVVKIRAKDGVKD